MSLGIRPTNAREKAIRDHQWAIHVARDEGIKEGIKEGEVKTIRLLQRLLGLPMTASLNWPS